MKRRLYPEPISALELFQPGPEITYSIEEAARLARVPRRLIAVYLRYGLVAPAADPDIGGWYFDGEGIRTLRQIERLRNSLGMSLMAVKLVLGLSHEVERLRQEVRSLRRPFISARRHASAPQGVRDRLPVQPRARHLE